MPRSVLYCSVLDIVGNIPQFEDILDLYYHCKICSEPQAYLEQEIFLQHVQQNHSEYWRPSAMLGKCSKRCPLSGRFVLALCSDELYGIRH